MVNEKHVIKFCVNYKDIENYEQAINDKDQIWVCHHRLETHFSDGTERPKDAQLTVDELILLEMYYHRPPEEFIFLPRSKHISLHKKNSHFTEEAKRKISEHNARYWLGKKLPEESKRKSSETKKGHKVSEETRRKISNTLKGHPAWNKGKKGIYSEETRKRMSESAKRRCQKDKS